MDIEKFMQQTPPKAMRSRLVPYVQQIILLKTKGYSNKQVREWLSANGMEISLEGLRLFINKNCTSGKGTTNTESTNPHPIETQGDHERGLTLRQKGEIEAAKYIKPDAMSPLAQRILDKQQRENEDESSCD
jgi:hypothetical protein